MVPKTSFVLISNARSGTTLAMDQLNQHPDIYAHLEIFAARNPQTRLRQEYKDRFGHEDVHADPLGFLANVRSFAPHQSCVGFKMWPSQSRLVYDAVLADASIHKIVHQRTNYLASVSSNEIARATGLSHLVSAQQKKAARDMPRPLLRFDAEALRRLTLRRRRQFLRTLERAKGPTLTTTHLGLVENGPAGLYDFLGLAPFTPVARHKKVNSQNILARYHTDDHALILETLEELGVPDWVSEDRESHIVTPADRDAIRAAKKAARQAARRAAKQTGDAKPQKRSWLARFWRP